MATASVTSPAGSRSIDEIRAEFPILERRVNGQPLAYLDNGATAQTPLQVLEAMDRYWTEHNANVHRGVHTLSEEATNLYEGARATIARHLGTNPRDVIFTRNVTGAVKSRPSLMIWATTGMVNGHRSRPRGRRQVIRSTITRQTVAAGTVSGSVRQDIVLPVRRVSLNLVRHGRIGQLQ